MYNFIVVDDEYITRESFACILDWDKIGFRVVGTFSDGLDAYNYIEENKNVHLVISDIKMPVMSGLNFIEKLHKNYPDIIVILISGFSDFEYVRTAIKYKAFDYLQKPTSYDDIVDAFSRAKKELDGKYLGENKYDNKITVALAYIENHISDDISLEYVAEHIGMSSVYFSKYFKQNTGKKYIEYIKEKRINLAMKYLSDPTLKINEICDMVGYKSMHHFLKVFKEHLGISPSDYRKKLELLNQDDEN